MFLQGTITENTMFCVLSSGNGRLVVILVVKNMKGTLELLELSVKLSTIAWMIITGITIVVTFGMGILGNPIEGSLVVRILTLSSSAAVLSFLYYLVFHYFNKNRFKTHHR